jgi:heterodisulfide reductase subunit A
VPLTADPGIYRVLPEDLVLSSAVAAGVMSDVHSVSNVHPSTPAPGLSGSSHRIGVFICRCGDAIAQTVDVEAVSRRAAGLVDVICSQILPFSCTLEAEKTVGEMISSLDLDQVVLAACACCSLDQVCYSCTYQRIRCKQIFGLFDSQPSTPVAVDFTAGESGRPIVAELVNIREHCAWVHRDDPPAATSKAAALIAAAVAKIRMASSKSLESQAIERSVLILGSAEAARACRDHLQTQDIRVRQLDAPPSRILRTDGAYAVRQNGYTLTAESMVLAPRGSSEADGLKAAFGSDAHQPRIRSIWGGLETHLPGVFYCDPAADDAMTGAAAAARVCAWLGRCTARARPNTAVVDAHRCRACHSCVDVCEFGAPYIVGREENRSARVDPNICVGCGTCAAQCPSGAISAGYSTDEQLDAMIDAVLSS